MHGGDDEKYGHFRVPKVREKGQMGFKVLKSHDASLPRRFAGPYLDRHNDGFEGTETVPGRSSVFLPRNRHRPILGVGMLCLSNAEEKKTTTEPRIPVPRLDDAPEKGRGPESICAGDIVETVPETPPRRSSFEGELRVDRTGDQTASKKSKPASFFLSP